MTKWKDTTKGGLKILWREEIKEGERKGWSCGKVDNDEFGKFCMWSNTGMELIYGSIYNLVPVEPEVVDSRWINLFKIKTASMHLTIADADKYAVLNGSVIGRIRIDWLDNGTYTVTKEEV